MTVPVLTQAEFIDYLKEQGCEVVSDEFWNDWDRIMMKKGDISFPLQVRESYAFPLVCKVCQSIGVAAPEDHQKCYDQYMEMFRSLGNGGKA